MAEQIFRNGKFLLLLRGKRINMKDKLVLETGFNKAHNIVVNTSKKARQLKSVTLKKGKFKELCDYSTD